MNFNLTPLTIETNTQQNHGDSHIWSPFSTPAFSPFSQTMSPQFQYSNFNSPNSSRAIFKSSHSTIMSPLSVNSLSRTVVASPRQCGYVQQENYHFNPRGLPRRSEQIDLTETIRQAAIQRAMGGRVKVCTFCKTNGEQEQVYTSHTLKDSNGNVTCPILKNYSCPECGASGEKTHTKKYCPQLQKRLRLEMLKKYS